MLPADEKIKNHVRKQAEYAYRVVGDWVVFANIAPGYRSMMGWAPGTRTFCAVHMKTGAYRWWMFDYSERYGWFPKLLRRDKGERFVVFRSYKFEERVPIAYLIRVPDDVFWVFNFVPPVKWIEKAKQGTLKPEDLRPHFTPQEFEEVAGDLRRMEVVGKTEFKVGVVGWEL